MLRLPPDRERLRIEEGLEYLRGRRDDDEIGGEFEQRLPPPICGADRVWSV
jgi:hypothetical protein